MADQMRRAGAGTGARPAKHRADAVVWSARIIAFLIFAFLAYSIISWAAGTLSVIGVSSPTTVTLRSGSSALLSINGTEYAAYLVSGSTATGSAVVSITKLPAFVNPNLYITLSGANSSTNIETQGKYANLQLKLVQVNATVAQVLFTPIPQSLGIAPSYGSVTYVSALIGGNVTAGSTTTPTTTTTTTTVSTTTSTTSSTTSSTSSSTSSSTTTVSGNGAGQLAAQALLKKDVYYALMVNYTKLYDNTSSCTVSMYNADYLKKHGTSPSGPNDYANASAVVPYSMTLNITSQSSTQYTAKYITASHTAVTTGVALAVIMDISSNVILSNTFSGALQGSTLATLSSGYNDSVSIGNACGVLIG